STNTGSFSNTIRIGKDKGQDCHVDSRGTAAYTIPYTGDRTTTRIRRNRSDKGMGMGQALQGQEREQRQGRATMTGGLSIDLSLSMRPSV
ncbi:hypothetical protein BGX33_010751, partial [Mortierella sp. NVP41]